MEYVNLKYRVAWKNPITEKIEPKIDWNFLSQSDMGLDNMYSYTNIHLDNIVISCHFFEVFEIENDIDPTQFTSIEHHKTLMEYMRAISFLLNNPIILTSENLQGDDLIRIEGNQIEIGPKKT